MCSHIIANLASKDKNGQPAKITDNRISQNSWMVLYVDDEKDAVYIGKRIFEHFGFNVFATTSSLEALETFQIRPDHFDVVITDQCMPEMNGEDLAKKLLIIRPDLPIILYTAFSNTITTERAKSQGIRELLTKPLEQEKLVEAVKRHGRSLPDPTIAI